MKTVIIYAEHTALAGKVCHDEDLSGSDDVIELDVEQAQLWANLPATCAADFRRRAGCNALTELAASAEGEE